MKKLFISTLFCFFCVLSLHAFSIFKLGPSRPECVTKDFDKLLNRHHYTSDADKISEFSLEFSMEEKQSVYDYYKLDGAKAASENANGAWPAFGSGSFSQGDFGAGMLLLFTDAIAWGTAYGGALVFCYSMVEFFGTFGVVAVADPERTGQLMNGGLIAMCTGFVIGMTADYIYGGIRPRVYAARQNESLKKALGLDDKEISVHFVPSVNPVDASFSLGIEFSL